MSELPATPRGRRAARPDHAPLDAHAFEAAVYGTIIATALVAAQRHDPARDVVATLLGATVVVWLAHMWTGMVVGSIEHGPRFTVAKARLLFHQERPLLTSGLVPAAIVALAWAGLYSDATGAWIAIVAGLLELGAWGFVAARQSTAGAANRVLTGSVFSLLGVAIVALEVAVTH